MWAARALRALACGAPLWLGCIDEVDFRRLASPDAGPDLRRDLGGAGAGSAAGTGAGSAAGTGAGSAAGVGAGGGAGVGAGVGAGGGAEGGTGVDAGAGAGVNGNGDSPALVGAWESAGEDVAPLLRAAPFNLRRLAARFGADGAFVVSGENADRRTFDLEGTFALTPAPGAPLSALGVIHEVRLTQTAPERAVSVGVWRVDGDVLTYEVVQVEPPISGQSPPTRAGGFGSSTNGAFGVDNVQTYRRAP